MYRNSEPGRTSQWLLLSSVALTTAPHVLYQPAWVSLLVLISLLLRAAMLRKNLEAPLWLLALAGVLLIAAIRHQFGYFFGQQPGTAFLTVMLCLKLLESRKKRDVFLSVLLCFFLQIGLFLYDQSAISAVMAGIGMLFAYTTLLSLQDSRSSPLPLLRTTAVLLCQGLPFMLVLFLLFPRIDGPLWAMPNEPKQHTTGLSDSMTPGSISKLSLSHALAFRVQFQGEPPAREQLYWRGPVFSQFDGFSWKASFPALNRHPLYRPSGKQFDYVMTLEPHGHRWLLALDFPGDNIAKANYAHDYQLLAHYPLRSRRQLALSAFPETQPGIDEYKFILQLNRRIPPESNPRTQQLGHQIAANSASPEQIVAQAIAELRAHNFVYTLSPPRLGAEAIDEFLFETRAGFCEHFSSAFVFLLRSAGLPARVVTGYQGGEINPVDNSLIVRQSDAHAWAEVWLQQRGWVRIDPTAIIEPRRISGGLSEALAGDEQLPFMLKPSMGWLRKLSYQWEALSYRWDQWVLGYGQEQQRRLFESLGLDDIDNSHLVSFLLLALGIVLVLFLASAVWSRQKLDPLVLAWVQFCSKLAKHGVIRHPWEGPIQFGERAAAALPQHAKTLRTIATHYARLRYAHPGNDSHKQYQLLLQLIRTLKLK